MNILIDLALAAGVLVLVNIALLETWLKTCDRSRQRRRRRTAPQLENIIRGGNWRSRW